MLVVICSSHKQKWWVSLVQIATDLGSSGSRTVCFLLPSGFVVTRTNFFLLAGASPPPPLLMADAPSNCRLDPGLPLSRSEVWRPPNLISLSESLPPPVAQVRSSKSFSAYLPTEIQVTTSYIAEKTARPLKSVETVVFAKTVPAYYPHTSKLRLFF